MCLDLWKEALEKVKSLPDASLKNCARSFDKMRSSGKETVKKSPRSKVSLIKKNVTNILKCRVIVEKCGSISRKSPSTLKRVPRSIFGKIFTLIKKNQTPIFVTEPSYLVLRSHIRLLCQLFKKHSKPSPLYDIIAKANQDQELPISYI